MEPTKNIPLRNQGETLPTDFPYRGQWLHKGLLFLYRPQDQRTLGAKEMTAVAKWGDDVCAGINAMQLAFALQVSSEEIFHHNGDKTLFLVRTEKMPPVHGGVGAKRYIFQIGDRQAAIIIEGGGPIGNA